MEKASGTVSVRDESGGLVVEAGNYRLTFPAGRPFAVLADAAGTTWAELFLGSSLHTTAGLDETAAFSEPVWREEPGGVRVTVGALSSLWEARELVFVCRPTDLRASVRVRGRGQLADVHLFGGYSSAHTRFGSGFFPSGARWRSLFNPEPSKAERRAVPGGESAVIDVMGTSLPGKRHWFFTPAPLCFAASRSPAEAAGEARGGFAGADQGGTPFDDFAGAVSNDGAGGEADDPGPVTALAWAEERTTAPSPAGQPLPAGPWLTFGLGVARGGHHFTGFHYDATEWAFSLRLAYEGQTAVDGEFETPAVIFVPDAPDPYEGLDRHRRVLVELGLVDPPTERVRPDWWEEPILCGWGAQCHLANVGGGRAPEYCRQEHYDDFLGHLAPLGLVPGVVVLDDKWQKHYATCEADPEKWPDLRGWIAGRHAEGQKVLLWWKAWDFEGLPVDQCVTNAAGQPVAADPSNPAYEASLRAAARLMLSHDGYDADGIKMDFSARSPSGPGLRHHGPEWGIELLHKLLEILYTEAKAVKPDALIMTHTPNPYFADVSDMIRLNDINDDAPVVDQMRHRARVAQAACPQLLIDTDNWPMPSRAAWREYLGVQLELGVPSLYFITHFDFTKEALEAEDYQAVSQLWADHRAKRKAVR